MNYSPRDELIEDLKNIDFKKSFGSEAAKLEIGSLLYKARKNANLTQIEMSEKLGVKQPYIARLEAGEANPTISAIGSILAMLDFRLTANVLPLIPQTVSDTFDTKQQKTIDATLSINWEIFLQSNESSDRSIRLPHAGGFFQEDIQQDDRDLVPVIS